MNVIDSEFLQIFRFGLLNDKGDGTIQQILKPQMQWDLIYSCFKMHAVAPLAFEIIRYISDDYRNIQAEWKSLIYSSIYNGTKIKKNQSHILEKLQENKIPVVVLKGSSAAKYYPKPQLRTMGDIDLLVKPKDYERAVEIILDSGCRESTSTTELEKGRHRNFDFNGTEIELHHRFASPQYGTIASVFDEMLFNAIPDNDTILPDEENGLVLLSHIRQHLKNGLGLRQIIDWFMFVQSCLKDEMWYNSFRAKAQITGLESLAITVTKMCQKYLGLTTENITWCKNAKEETCDNLMIYILNCGNFGRSRNTLQSGITSKISLMSHPILMFKFLQSRGKSNWKILDKHPYLKPFAWLYQLCRYITLAVQDIGGTTKLKKLYGKRNNRNDLFVELKLK